MLLVGEQFRFDAPEPAHLIYHVGQWKFVYVCLWLKDIYLWLPLTRIADVQLVGTQNVVLYGHLTLVLVSRRVVDLSVVVIEFIGYPMKFVAGVE